MKDFRCSNCNRLLAKVDGGKIEIKCPHCREMNEMSNGIFGFTIQIDRNLPENELRIVNGDKTHIHKF